MSEFMKVVTVQEALQLMASSLPERDLETISVLHALDRELAAAVYSPEPIPSFTRSTVDGYAVRAEDTFGCSESLPAFLSYQGEILMGQKPALEIMPGQCCWIPTGGMLPSGTNAAVMVEYTERLGDDTVLVYKPVGPGDHIMQAGEDAAQGSVLLPQNHCLRPQDLGLLASAGVEQVNVHKKYRVGIISTGNEIVALGSRPQPGQVRDVNSVSLAAAVQSAGALAQTYSIVPDDKNMLQEAVAAACEENDWVLMSGGSSIGIKDMTMEVLLSFPQTQLLFHGIAAKPGKPTLAVKIGTKLVVGLPGHPVSALTMFGVVCKPFLDAKPSRQITAIAGTNIASQAGRDDYIAVYLEERNGQRVAQPLLGKSGLMTILSRADGYIHIEHQQQGIYSGDTVLVTHFD
ncbi:MAG: gephyrin-like molybdotransferase Glp [Syntrophomonadaceae bacterium]|jgi:molybdopterin molybdotransferase|nr:molybdopterin molybdotransferase MoeA [Syntrophomonadaceae bacterium]HQD90210.1 molybdopterin molybdotransferase MoeA [Syntrophomonadaceae bacterium]